jgi:hypothetical protein
MNLSQKIAAAVEAQPESGGFPRSVSAEHEDNALTLQLTAAGPVGLAFDSLTFTTKARAEWSAEALRNWGDHVAKTLSYLMEPLVVLEQDPIAGEVELRSQSPTGRAGARSFYEIRLQRSGTLTLSRVSFDETTRKRRHVPCQLTGEVIERLTDDLVASVA